MASRVANHIHRYRRVNIASATLEKEYWVYKCQKPACSHYISVLLSEGKLCECNRCNEPMIIGKVQLNGSNGRAMTRPHCLECIQKKKKTDVDKISGFLAKNPV